MGVELDGVPVYLRKELQEYFTVHPLILTTRGPRLAIEKDDNLINFEQSLSKNIASERDE